MENIQICKECGKEFFRKHRWVYCSENCRNIAADKRNKARQLAAVSNGTINGRSANKHFYLLYQRSAKARDYSFNLSEEQFNQLWQKPCYYCGADIKHIGIDRVDNTRGYESNNVIPCCTQCNKMKRSYTQQEFLSKCIAVADLHR